MAKSGKKDAEKGKKDHLPAKKGPGSVLKAKDKRKKLNTKKVMDKLGRDIKSVNEEFTELQSKMVSEKENEKVVNCDASKEPKTPEVLSQPSISQEKQVEETTQNLSNL